MEATFTQKTTHPMAILSVILGALGILNILPLIGSVGAILAANMARRELVESTTHTGYDLTTVGLVLGWLGIAISILASVVVGIFFLFFMGPVIAVGM